MVVTENLMYSFEKNREVHRDKLDYLLSIWVHPEFAKKCAQMFNEIWATTEEILSQEEKILEANDEIFRLDMKRNRLQRKSVVDFSV